MNILLVDDDAAILKSLLPVLNGLDGHTVRVSTSFEKALEHALDLGLIHLLITDVVMEPVDGFTLRDRLRDRFPDLRTILLTGYDLSDYPAQIEGYTVVEKPADLDEFRAAITRELQAVPTNPRVEEPATEETASDEEPQEQEEPARPVAPPVSEEPNLPAPASVPAAAPAPGTPVAPSKPKVPGSPAPAEEEEAPPEISHVPEPKLPSTQAQSPVASPPTITPSAGPTPRPMASGMPAAIPSARPAPAVPTARPATPTATPAAPTATPRPTPVASPSATPKVSGPTVGPGVPKVAMPRPAGVPMAKPTVSAPGALSKPAARPAGTPVVAVPKPAVVAPGGPKPSAAPVPSVAPSASGAEADALEGRQLGAYRIIRRVSEGKWGPTYEAEQVSMGRTVSMKVLAEDFQKDPGKKKQFIANASAKANVQHPVILSVYEAGEADGHCYYTHEHVDGDDLAVIAQSGRSISDATALLAIRVAAEGIGFITSQKVRHSALQPSSILVGSDQRPRLANLAVYGETEAPDTQAEIQTLADAVSNALPEGAAASGSMQKLFAKMRATGESGFQSWPALLQAVKALEPKVIPADAFKLSAQEQEAIRAVEAEKKSQKKGTIKIVAGMLLLLLAVLLAIYRVFFYSNERDTDELVKISAGEFIFQDGQKVTLPDFYIDRYEVTIGQYARFLEALEKNPGPDGKPDKQFDHQDQPPDKLHYPRSKSIWDTFYGRAKAGKPAKYIPIDLNSPVFNVDWWDAYAYAKWKGRRLPTEQEWEKAARGTDGRRYPWGNEFDPQKVNSSADYTQIPGPKTEATIDGYFWWSPVDAITGDKSPYGVIGMAGNLNEWTSTWEEKDGTKFPVVRGGSYRSNEDGKPDVAATFRFVGLDPESSQEFLGFRTASDTE